MIGDINLTIAAQNLVNRNGVRSPVVASIVAAAAMRRSRGGRKAG